MKISYKYEVTLYPLFFKITILQSICYMGSINSILDLSPVV